MPECAIFADTQAEPMEVYKWLDWLETKLPFPIHRVSKGSLAEVSTTVRTSKGGNNYTKAAIPAFITDGIKTGIAMRQCTSDFKIIPIQKKIRELRNKRPVTQWIGISYDEVIRMKPSRIKYIKNIWPLVDLKMTREDCIAWMRLHGFPKPPRSACVFCPYHSNKEWNRLKSEQPGEFAKAIVYEGMLQEAFSRVKNFRGKPFLHRSLLPLSEIDFSTPETKQIDMFNNECEGMCGV